MPAKPSSDTILSSYSIEELLELVKEKSKQMASEQVQQFSQQINQLASSSSSSSQTNETQSVKKKQTAEQISDSSQRKILNKTPSKRSGKSLSNLILQILENSTEPLKVDDLLKALKKKKWQTKSDNPKQVIQIELHKLLQKEQIERADRGLYQLA